MHCKFNYLKIQKQRFINVLQNRCSKKFRKFHWKNTCVGVSFWESWSLMPATLLKRDSNTGIFLWNLLFFKISNSNNLFKDSSTTSFTHNKSLITCISDNNKQIWKCIHLLKTCYDRAFKHKQLCWNLMEIYFSLPISLFFSLH